MSHKLRIAVLVSGSCTLLKAMPAGGLKPDLVIADRVKKCVGREVARDLGVPFRLVRRANFGLGNAFDRLAYTLEVIKVLRKEEIDVVAMAGFMTIFHKVMFQKENFHGRVLNIHPALLPAFKGPNVVEDALKFRVKITGTTVHLATAKLDTGSIIAQKAVRIRSYDTVETLHERIKIEERKLYPPTILRFVRQLATAG